MNIVKRKKAKKKKTNEWKNERTNETNKTYSGMHTIEYTQTPESTIENWGERKTTTNAASIVLRAQKFRHFGANNNRHSTKHSM